MQFTNSCIGLKLTTHTVSSGLQSSVYAMDPLTSIGSAIDFRMPSELNLLMYLHWHHMKDPDDDREKAADLCHLVRHIFRRRHTQNYDYPSSSGTCATVAAAHPTISKHERVIMQQDELWRLLQGKWNLIILVSRPMGLSERPEHSQWQPFGAQ